jgi:hypothetical protein
VKGAGLTVQGAGFRVNGDRLMDWNVGSPYKPINFEPINKKVDGLTVKGTRLMIQVKTQQ